VAQSPKDAAQYLPAARAGSREALGQALEICRSYLLSVANQGLDQDLRAKGGASDLVQETFLEAQRDFGTFQGSSEEELLAWLRLLLLHNVANFTRRYRGTDKRRVAREVGLDGTESAAGRRARLATDTPSPSSEAMAHEQAEKIQQALERLPEDYRRVILLRNQERRSFEEIGPLMGRSAEAARRLWSRAIERLQRELEAAS
jgi:RNA polymerase sigma-70 factor (ECF subfamily)